MDAMAITSCKIPLLRITEGQVTSLSVESPRAFLLNKQDKMLTSTIDKSFIIATIAQSTLEYSSKEQCIKWGSGITLNLLKFKAELWQSLALLRQMVGDQ